MARTFTQHGFSLIEMMVTVAVLAIVLGLGLPAFQETIARNNITAESNRLIASINFARSQAVAKGQVVTLSRNGAIANDWSQGWVVYTDTGREGNQPFDSNNDVLLKEFTPNSSQILIRANNAAASWISFSPSGRIIPNGNAARLTICDPDIDSSTPGRLITVSVVGRPAVFPINADQKQTLCNPNAS